jgi:ribosomal protein S18 acetylase RimI-like enzyme
MTDLRMVHPGPLPAEPLPPRGGSVTLRACRESDAVELGGLLADSFPEWGWSQERALAELINGPDIQRVWLAVDGQTPVGTASQRVIELDGIRQGEVYWVAVAPSCRGRGVGAALTSAVLAGFSQAGLARALLDTQDDRLTAITMYLRFGFIPSPRTVAEEAGWSQVLAAIASRRTRSGLESAGR